LGESKTRYMTTVRVEQFLSRRKQTHGWRNGKIAFHATRECSAKATICDPRPYQRSQSETSGLEWQGFMRNVHWRHVLEKRNVTTTKFVRDNSH